MPWSSLAAPLWLFCHSLWSPPSCHSIWPPLFGPPFMLFGHSMAPFHAVWPLTGHRRDVWPLYQCCLATLWPLFLLLGHSMATSLLLDHFSCCLATLWPPPCYWSLYGHSMATSLLLGHSMALLVTLWPPTATCWPPPCCLATLWPPPCRLATLWPPL